MARRSTQRPQELPDGFFHRTWEKEKDTVKNAPISFAICVALSLCVTTPAVYWLVDHLYASTISANNATILSLTTQRDDFKAKLDSQKGTQQKPIAIVDNLPKSDPHLAGAVWNNGGVLCISDTDLHEWEPLTDEQIKLWVGVLKTYKIPSISVCWGQSVIAQKFYRSLEKLAIELKTPIATSFGTVNVKMIDICCPKNNPVGPVLLKLFKDANYPAELDDHDQDCVLIGIGDKP